MSATMSKQIPISIALMMASIGSVFLIYVIWNAWMRTDFGLTTISAWSDISWQIAEVDSRGRIIRLGPHPFAIATMIGLVTVCFMAFATGVWQFLTGNEIIRKRTNDAISNRLDKVGQELDDEVLAFMGVLREHINLSSTHSQMLENVDKALPGATSIEQVRAIVQRLMSDNKKTRSEVDALNARLQNSQAQIEKLRAALIESQSLGMIDAVTQLKNRHWLQRNLPREVNAASENERPLSLIMADVDHFKKINDTFGHAVGDEILRRFSELLSKNIKAGDSAVRFGGEEFVLILPHTDLKNARDLGELIRSELENKKWMHHKTGLPIGTVTASFGIAQLQANENHDSLLERADAKLYEAKAAGRNCVRAGNGLM